MATDEIDANGWRFTVRQSGAAGEPVLLLHGFPETSAMWESTIAALVDAGYRCLAPDQRGYSPGARPEEIEQYSTEHLVDDAFALTDAVGWDRFHLVAHDWGAAVAWLAAIGRPARIASMTVLSIPHYHAFAEATWSDPEEESYRRFLALVLAADGAAERVLGRNGLASFRAEWLDHSADEIAVALAVLTKPGALTAALAWYRASDGHRKFLSLAAPPVEVPTQLIWGRDEVYVRPLAVALGERIAVRDYRRVDLDAGHWLVQQRPHAVHAAILEQLRRYPIESAPTLV